MKLKELMTGNFIKVKATGENAVIKEMYVQYNDYTYTEKHSVLVYTVNTGSILNIEDIEPVELNEEILLKNGFEYSDESEFKKVCGDFTIIVREYANYNGRDWTVHIDNSDMDTVARVDIHYMHQLQNVFNLMDIDYNFKLF